MCNTANKYQTINLTKHFWDFVWPLLAPWVWVRYTWNLHQMIGNHCQNALKQWWCIQVSDTKGLISEFLHSFNKNSCFHHWTVTKRVPGSMETMPTSTCVTYYDRAHGCNHMTWLIYFKGVVIIYGRGGRWKRGGRKIVVQAVGGGAKIWCTALEGGQNFSAQTSECHLQACMVAEGGARF